MFYILRQTLLIYLVIFSICIAQSMRTDSEPGMGNYAIPFYGANTYRLNIQPPGEYLGFKLGSRPIHHGEVLDYYKYLDKILDNVNLTLRRGQVTALVGQTGSGKSTIADLIIRLYDPNAGSIIVDDTDLRKIDLSAWRKRVGFVGQDPYLFHTTLKNNITLWDPTINDTEIERAMHTAQLTDFLSSLPDGYETLVGDRGLKLSGGQRQRVAIARAILNQPDVLIFDEATSSLDNLTEKEVHDAISKLREGATVLVIAHRLTTVSDANVVVVLDQGNIVEQGHPDDLISSRGKFWRLYQNDSDASEHQIASI